MLKYFYLLRPEHWIKNFLVFVPLLASHQINSGTINYGLLAFISFCAIASCGYIINDIVDVNSDKFHYFNSLRPIASGNVSKKKALIIFFFLMLFASFTSLYVNTNYFFIILSYFFLTILYSLIIKKLVVLDLFFLSTFYTIRVLAGSQATNITISSWLLSFLVFFFLSFATLKRQIELVYLKKNIKNRGYLARDLATVSIMSFCSGYISILILILYINSPQANILYQNIDYLWGIILVLLYWITKINFKAGRGLIHYDPLLHVVKDKESYICLGAILIFLLKAMR